MLIQAMTTIVCPTMYCGVPKKRAAFSANRPNVSSPNVPWRCTGREGTDARLEHVPDELEDPALVLALEVEAQLLVELDPDEQHDRADIEERREEIDGRERSDCAFVVRGRAHVPAEDQRLDDPEHDDERGAARRPSFRPAFRRREADEHA